MKYVRDIMTSDVITIHREKSVCETEVILCSNKISGAPVVDDEGSVVGMVSLTDLNGFETTDDDHFYAKVWEVASPRAISIHPSATVTEAANKMLEARIHRLLVIDDEEIAGVISAFDFIRLWANENDAAA